jgi:hypothetical protein
LAHRFGKRKREVNGQTGLLKKEEVHNAVQELDSQIGGLESDVEDFDSQKWRDVVPRIKESAESVRGTLDELKKALGYQP